MNTAGLMMDGADAMVQRQSASIEGVVMRGIYEVVCVGPDGLVRWREIAKNMLVNAGVAHVLDAVFSGSSQVATWYNGLCGTSPTVASGDTMSSHAGWGEFAGYSEGTRQTWTEVRSGLSMTNSAAKAAYSINADSSTIGGVFLSSSNVKSASSGTLMSAVAFTGGNKSAASGDTLSVTYTLSMADDGV